MKFAFTADLHLREQVWKSRPDLTGDTYYALEQIVDWCVADRTNLVLGGDQFDSPYPSSADMHFLQVQVNRLRAAGLSVFAYDGNHDGQAVSWIEQIHGLENLNERLTEICPGVPAYALNFRPAPELAEALARVPATTQVLLLHQFDRNVVDIPGQWDFDPAWIPPMTGLKVVLLGHIHRPSSHTDPVSRVVYAYCGSPSMHEISETHPKSFIVVDTQTWELRRQPLLSRHVATAVLPDEQTLSAFIAEFGPKLLAELPPVPHPTVSRPIIKVRYPDDLPGALSRLRAAFGTSAYIWPDPQRAADAEAAAAAGNTLEEAVGALIDKVKQPELFEMLTSLLGTLGDPSAAGQVLEHFRVRHGVQRPGVAA